MTATDCITDNLHKLRALVKVYFLLAENVAVLSGVPVLQRAGYVGETNIHWCDISLRHAGSSHAATDFWETYGRTFDTTTLTHSTNQHCLALVSLFDFSIE